MIKSRRISLAVSLGLAFAVLLLSCQSPIGSKTSAARSLKLSFIVQGRTSTAARSTAAGARLLLPTAATLTVTLTPLVSGSPVTQTAAIPTSTVTQTVPVTFSDLAYGTYKISAVAYAADGTTEVFTSVDKSFSFTGAVSAVTLNMLPSGSEFASIAATDSQTLSLSLSSLSGGSPSVTYQVTPDALWNGSYTLDLPYQQSDLMVFAQDADGTLLASATGNSDSDVIMSVTPASSTATTYLTFYNAGTSDLTSESCAYMAYYPVGSAAALASIGASSSSRAGSYLQIADIDLSGYGSWSPIGDSSDTYFGGTFNGNGHRITGLSINSTSAEQGLFGYCSGATLTSVSVSGSVAQSGENMSGGLLVGEATSNTTITDCTASGSVSGYGYIGLLAGYVANGTVTGCTASGTVYSSGGNYVGGLIGNAESTYVAYSSSSATLTGTGVYVGGLVGIGEYGATITRCSATGSVTASDYVGGFAGGIETSDGSGTSVTDCYATGSVNSANTGAGVAGFVAFVGANSSNSITSCYSAGAVSSIPSNRYGFANSNGATISACFWDTGTSGIGTSGESETSGATGESTALMKTAATFSDWSSTYWNLVDGSYPTLKSADSQPIAN